MPQKTLSELQQEIDAAVNPAGGLPLTTGPHLNAVLGSLATELTSGPARPGADPSAVVVASPDLANEAQGYAAVSLGGQYNTAAADTGAVVGGQRLHLPPGADNSVLLGGQNYEAPAQADTVFVPNLVVWDKGGRIQLPDEEGYPHQLGVAVPGILTLDGKPVGGSRAGFVAYVGRTDDFVEFNPETGVVPIKNFERFPATDNPDEDNPDENNPDEIATGGTMDGTMQETIDTTTDPAQVQAVKPPVLSLEGQGCPPLPVRGLYEITTYVRIKAGELDREHSFGQGGGPAMREETLLWTSGAASAELPSTSYNARCLVLDKGQMVRLFVQCQPQANPLVYGELTVRLLQSLPSK